ncbi:MAG: Ig-like domain-containing protein, partial [Clostridia bacterium]
MIKNTKGRFLALMLALIMLLTPMLSVATAQVTLPQSTVETPIAGANPTPDGSENSGGGTGEEATPTPIPETTPTPIPETTPTPMPEVTPTPMPEVTPTPMPEVTPTPMPEVTPTPVPMTAQQVLDAKFEVSGLVARLRTLEEETDYVPYQGLFMADTQEQAMYTAQQYGATLLSFDYGMGMLEFTPEYGGILEDTQTKLDALPKLYPNFIYALSADRLSTVKSSAPAAPEPESGADRWQPNDPYLPGAPGASNWAQYHHSLIDSFGAWVTTRGDAGVLVAVMDTGLVSGHVDLDYSKITRVDCYNADASDPNDRHGHGTHVAGIIAATANNGYCGAGVAPGVSIVSVKVLDLGSNGKSTGTTQTLINGLNYCLGTWSDSNPNNNVDIVNMSLGMSTYDALFQEKMKQLTDAGILLVAAAGNSGSATSLIYPAAYSDAFAVGAVDASKDKTWFSNYGTYVDIVAPGDQIVSTSFYQNSSYIEKLSGTSQASPIVAGIAALVLSVNHPLHAMQGRARVEMLKNILLTSASPSNFANSANEKLGMVNAKAAIDMVGGINRPIFGKGSGCIYESDSITINGAQSSDIFYTLDGSKPSANGGLRYTGGIAVSSILNSFNADTKKLTVKAVCVINGETSAVATVTYTLCKKTSQVVITGPLCVLSGGSIQLAAQVSPDDATNKNVLWNSTDTTVATVNSTGMVSARSTSALKTVTITAIAQDGFSPVATYTISVLPYASSISIQNSSTGLVVSGSTLYADVTDGAYKVQLRALVNPQGAQSNVAWSSSNTGVATVNTTGEVTVINSGTATITARATDGSNRAASVNIKAMQLVKKIDISGADSIAIGKSAQLTANVLPVGAENRTVTWTSESTSIATVNSNGRVTVRSNAPIGAQVTITATARDGSNVSGKCIITVMPVTTGVIINYNGTNLTSNQSLGLGITEQQPNPELQLGAYCTPNTGTYIVSQDVQWSSSNLSVANVDETGKVIGVRNGRAVITATATDGSGKSARCTIEVVKQVTQISIDGAGHEVAAGRNVQLTANVTPYDATNKRVMWSSSDNSIATVSSNGRVNARNVDGIKTVTISATAMDGCGAKGTWELKVTPIAQTVVIERKGQDVINQTLGIDLAAEDKTIQLTSSIMPADASQGVRWQSSSPRVATVDSNGLITGIARGTATITATATDGSNRRSTVRINVATMVKGITVSGSDEVAAGRNVQLTANVTPYDATNKRVMWSSSDNSIATVSSNGRVNARNVDGTKTVTISATAMDGSGVSASKIITVTPIAQTVAIARNGQDVINQTLGIDLA